MYKHLNERQIQEVYNRLLGSRYEFVYWHQITLSALQIFLTKNAFYAVKQTESNQVVDIFQFLL